MTTPPAAPGPLELTDALLDFVVGGAGDPPPAVLERLLRAGAIRKLPSSHSTDP